jgi:hypothetical protein
LAHPGRTRRSLAPDADTLVYVLNLKLADPESAPAFIRRHIVYQLRQSRSSGPPPERGGWSCQYVRQQAAQLVRDEQSFLVTGAWLLGVLAVASVAVLVGGQPGVPPPSRRYRGRDWTGPS